MITVFLTRIEIIPFLQSRRLFFNSNSSLQCNYEGEWQFVSLKDWDSLLNFVLRIWTYKCAWLVTLSSERRRVNDIKKYNTISVLNVASSVLLSVLRSYNSRKESFVPVGNFLSLGLFCSIYAIKNEEIS